MHIIVILCSWTHWIEVTPAPSKHFSSMFKSYNRIPQSKSNKRGIHIMPGRHIKTDPSTSSNFVTLSPEYTKAPCLIWVRSLVSLFVFKRKPVSSSVVRSLNGIFVFRSKPVSNVYQHRWGDGEKRQVACLGKNSKRHSCWGVSTWLARFFISTTC